MSTCWQLSARSSSSRCIASNRGSIASSSRDSLAKSLFTWRSSSLLITPFYSIHRQSSSSTRWKSRQSNDASSREAKVRGLKSRAAFKLLELDSKYNLFKRGQTVIDLGYAPGSWSQIAVERTKPNGRVIGIDIIPAQPPKGASTIQGDFMSPSVQAEVKRFLSEPDRGRLKPPMFSTGSDQLHAKSLEREKSYIDLEQPTNEDELDEARTELQREPYRVVDVVLSDMSEPWEQTNGFWKRTLSDPYCRMINTTGNSFKDHSGSMDLCNAALHFANESLRVGGHFVCKFFQGAEDKEFEKKLKALFSSVHREKPQSSRSESREGFFVALRRKKPDGINPSIQPQPIQSTSIFT